MLWWVLMKNIFKHIPGFRTNAKWKKLVASILYTHLFSIIFEFPFIYPANANRCIIVIHDKFSKTNINKKIRNKR